MDSYKDVHIFPTHGLWVVTKLCKNFSFVKLSLHVQKNSGLVWDTDTFICEKNTDWTKCVGVSTDSGRSVSGCYGGLQAPIRRKEPDALWTHLIIHREGLVTKHLSPSGNLVLESVLKVANFISCMQIQRLWFHTVLHLLWFHKFWSKVIVIINNLVPAISTVCSAMS
jgi:hypothetical protein